MDLFIADLEADWNSLINWESDMTQTDTQEAVLIRKSNKMYRDEGTVSVEPRLHGKSYLIIPTSETGSQSEEDLIWEVETPIKHGNQRTAYFAPAVRNSKM